MSLQAKLAVVRLTESDCAVRRATITAAWRGFKQESARAATPGRVIGAGLITGFLSGLQGPSAKSPGSAIGGKLFGMLLDSALASFGGALAAGAAAAAEEQTAPHPGSGSTDRD